MGKTNVIECKVNLIQQISPRPVNWDHERSERIPVVYKLLISSGIYIEQ